MNNNTTQSLVVSSPPPQLPADRAAELDRWFRKLDTRKQLFMRSAVIEGLDDLAIANKIKAQYDDVRDYILYRKWRDADRAEAEDKKKNKLMVDQWREAISVKAQSVSLAALDMAGEAADRRDPFASRDLANAARGAASLVAMARQAECMDGKGADVGTSYSINMFYIPSPVKAEVVEKRVEAVVEETIQDVPHTAASDEKELF